MCTLTHLFSLSSDIMLSLKVGTMLSPSVLPSPSPSSACSHAKPLQSCLTLCDPMDCSPPGSSVHEILQAAILEWLAKPSSRISSQPRSRTHVSYVTCVGRRVLYHERHLGSPRVAQTLLEQVEASLSQPSQHWKNIPQVEQTLTLYSNWCSSWCLHSSKWPDPQRKAPTESTSLGPKGSAPRVGQPYSVCSETTWREAQGEPCEKDPNRSPRARRVNPQPGSPLPALHLISQPPLPAPLSSHSSSSCSLNLRSSFLTSLVVQWLRICLAKQQV